MCSVSKSHQSVVLRAVVGTLSIAVIACDSRVVAEPQVAYTDFQVGDVRLSVESDLILSLSTPDSAARSGLDSTTGAAALVIPAGLLKRFSVLQSSDARSEKISLTLHPENGRMLPESPTAPDVQELVARVASGRLSEGADIVEAGELLHVRINRFVYYVLGPRPSREFLAVCLAVPIAQSTANHSCYRQFAVGGLRIRMEFRGKYAAYAETLESDVQCLLRLWASRAKDETSAEDCG